MLTTKYNLKIVYHYRDRYCLFYTNELKFNRLIGLLGNNNDNPMDDVKVSIIPIHFARIVQLHDGSKCRSNIVLRFQDIFKMELTGDHRCASYDDSPYQCHDNETNVKFQWFNLLWKYNSPTLPCHDVIAIKDFLGHRHAQCSEVPSSLVNSYLALCGAKGIPVGITPRGKYVIEDQ